MGEGGTPGGTLQPSRMAQLLPVEYRSRGPVGSEGSWPNSPSGACHFLTRCGICETLPSARNRVPRLPLGRVTTPWIRTALSTARWEASEADGIAMQAVRDNRPLAVQRGEIGRAHV